eukprot:2917245-Amphidinium_carterae.1
MWLHVCALVSVIPTQRKAAYAKALCLSEELEEHPHQQRRHTDTCRPPASRVSVVASCQEIAVINGVDEEIEASTISADSQVSVLRASCTT